MQIDDHRRRQAPLASPAIDLAALRPRLPLVRELSDAHQDIVMGGGESQRFRAGASFCADRSDQEWVYFLVQGTIVVTGADGVVREHEAGAAGPLDCFHAPGQRCVSARAKSEATVFRIPQAMLARYVNFSSVKAVALPDVVELGAEDSADGLELALGIGVLARLSPSDIHRLLQQTTDVPVRAGDTILQQGDTADACFIVKHGVAEVDVERHGGTQYRVAMKGPGELFGEEALLAGLGRGATVRMRSDGVLIRIGKTEFARFIAPVYVAPVPRARAEAMVAEGACWLDLREPAEFQHGSLPEAINLPLAILRLRCTSLDLRQRYIVYSDDPGYSSLGNFLLGVAGLEAYFLDEPIDRLETTARLPSAVALEADVLVETADEASPDLPAAAHAAALLDSTRPEAQSLREDTVQIGLEDVRAVERQRYERRLRKAVTRLREEADERVRAAVQEVEMTYLTELENKHRQVLELKRKVAVQQRELWKLQRAAAKQTVTVETSESWPPALSPDSI